MALTTSTITGRVPLPDDASPKAAEVIFSLSGYDTEGNQVIPGGARARIVLEADGSLPSGAKLWRNTEGLRGTSYRVTVRWSEQDRYSGTVTRENDLGWVQVGDDSSYTLPDLLANPAAPAPGWYETVPREVWEDILGLAGRVSAIESSGWVVPSRIATAAVTPPALSPAVLDMLNGAGYAGLWSPASNFPGGGGVTAGQVWLVTAAGSRGGQAFTVGDRLVALVNSPSTTVYAGNWMRVQQFEVTQTSTDDTSGRILKVGDFGLGGYGALPSDFDAVTPVSQIIRGTDATLNRPFFWAQGMQFSRGPQNAVQFVLSNIVGGSVPAAMRRRNTSGWEDWQRFYTNQNIVGPVSQAGGVPGGAVIESGSNANGVYVRWADGTQICHHTATATYLAAHYVRAVWTLPAVFAAAPAVHVNPLLASAVDYGVGVQRDRWGIAAASSATNTSAVCDVYRSYGAPDIPATASVPLQLTAVGRWY